ncbi:MAG: diphthamide biosynthesis enzyme Dph2 [Candidatus Methanomethylophilaceae archaeon]|jgi:2-(3-amino-3-carboxypropyl)histidine synthase
MFDLRLDEVKGWVLSRGYRTVALQMPEGLKSHASRVASELAHDTGAEFIVLGDPCYGACDLSRSFEDYAEALVHFGHSAMPSLQASEDVLFVEVFHQGDIGDMLLPALRLLGDRVGLLATVQYLPMLLQAEDFLVRHGRQVFIGEGDGRIAHPGQVLGCNRSAAESVEASVDGFLFIGEGDFHPLAVSLGTDRPVLVLNPLDGSLRTLEDKKERILRRRFASIQSAMDARSFLVIVSSKRGQDRFPMAEQALRDIRAAGKEAMMLVIEEVSPDRLMHYPVDAYVNTACPRIALDDQVLYRRPMLTLPELDIVLGKEQWGSYRFDAISPAQQR